MIVIVMLMSVSMSVPMCELVLVCLLLMLVCYSALGTCRKYPLCLLLVLSDKNKMETVLLSDKYHSSRIVCVFPSALSLLCGCIICLPLMFTPSCKRSRLCSQHSHAKLAHACAHTSLVLLTHSLSLQSRRYHSSIIVSVPLSRRPSPLLFCVWMVLVVVLEKIPQVNVDVRPDISAVRV